MTERHLTGASPLAGLAAMTELAETSRLAAEVSVTYLQAVAAHVGVFDLIASQERERQHGELRWSTLTPARWLMVDLREGVLWGWRDGLWQMWPKPDGSVLEAT